ncbi:MAG: hypothetical protein LAN71_14800 [Acidobacteriia bacterium]|nr:hypothetical protein [Terriglobia bacterium]
MARKIGRGIFAATLILALMFPEPAAMACGPFFAAPVFVQRLHPDQPLKLYARGELGILQPGYARMYLAVAYRNLSGAPFSAKEQQQLLSAWGAQADPNEEWMRNSGKKDPQQKWQEAVEKVKGPKNPEEKKQGRRSFAYLDFTNCMDDAFLTATQTLAARVQKFGKESAAVRSWTEVQEQVFENCNWEDPKKERVFPREAEEALPGIIRADRAYQIAAAHFYSKDWDDAEQRFLKIAEDPASPWKTIAALVAVRCRIRQATVSTENKATRMAMLAEAGERLKRLEADPAMEKLRPAILRLRGFVEFRANPGQRLALLSQALEKGSSPAGLRQDLIDYTWLLDRALGEDFSAEDDSKSPERVRLREELANLRKQGGMTDWILTFQGRGADSFKHALAKWNETHGVAWLVAALSKAKATDAESAELIRAAGEVPAGSSAYLTAAYHQARLLAASGKEEEARQAADKLLQLPDAQLNTSARNQVLALRMKLAVNFQEFLRFAPRRTAAIVSEGEDITPAGEKDCTGQSKAAQQECQEANEPPQLLDADAALAITEGLPTQLLAEAAESPTLPDNLRKRIALAAWVRAVLLGEEENGLRLTKTVAQFAPELAEGLKAFNEAQPGEARRFAAVFFILRNPGLHPYVEVGFGRSTPLGQIDNLRDNWWCSFATAEPRGYFYPSDSDYFYSGDSSYYTMFTGLKGPVGELYAGTKTMQPPFLTAAERTSATQEWSAITKLPAAPVWLGEQAIAFAKSHPEDARVPEALHRVVKATRFGCEDKGTGTTSKAAFQLLHRRYPASEWTKKTPLWF